MKSSSTAKALFLSALLATTASMTPAMAQVSFDIRIGPPQPIYETVPMMSPGYAWAPGYWAWHGDRHIWVHGRTMVQRSGYRWEADRWEQRGSTYYREPGRWERDGDHGRHNNGNNGNRGRGPRHDR